MQFLRGTENLYMDIAEESTGCYALLDKVHSFLVQQYHAWAKTEVDSLNIMDDWGSQRSLLIHPNTWRRVFKPRYAEYCEIARNAGKRVFMHSDGYIFDIYEDLIEIGVDAVNSQLFCMDIEEIGRRFAGRLTFWGEIDRQHILPEGSPAEAREAVRRVHDALWQNGGAVAQFELSHTGELAACDAVFEEWNRLTTREEVVKQNAS
jgi:uroporphyrinogen-III decarboxylase